MNISNIYKKIFFLLITLFSFNIHPAECDFEIWKKAKAERFRKLKKTTPDKSSTTQQEINLEDLKQDKTSKTRSEDSETNLFDILDSINFKKSCNLDDTEDIDNNNSPEQHVIVLGGGGVGAIIGGITSGPMIPLVITGVGIGFLIKGFIDKSKKTKNNGGGGSNGGGNNGDDDDEEEKRRKYKEQERFKVEHPNGKYEPSPKHNKNSPEGIGKPPKDGQKALDESITIPNVKWRIAIENKKVVVFEKTSEGVYHGYIVENPEILHQEIKNTLVREGWVKSITNLKIIKK